MALDVQTPWPSSVCAIRMVTVSSGEMTIHALISGAAGSSYQTAPDGPDAVCAFARGGTQKPRMKAPSAAATIARNSRRLIPEISLRRRAIALALRSLRLRAIALALRFLRLRAIALALRVSLIIVS